MPGSALTARSAVPFLHSAMLAKTAMCLQAKTEDAVPLSSLAAELERRIASALGQAQAPMVEAPLTPLQK